MTSSSSSSARNSRHCSSDIWRGGEPQGVVRTCGPHVGELLFLQIFTVMSSLLGVSAHYHTGIYRHAGPDKEDALLLCVEEAVGYALPVSKETRLPLLRRETSPYRGRSTQRQRP